MSDDRNHPADVLSHRDKKETDVSEYILRSDTVLQLQREHKGNAGADKCFHGKHEDDLQL